MENISTITVIARTTIAAVYRTAQIIASIPNLCYPNKAWAQILSLPYFAFLGQILHPNFLKFLFFFRHSLRLCFISYSQPWSIQTMKHELELTASFLLSWCRFQFALVPVQSPLSWKRPQIFQGCFQELSLCFLPQLPFLRSWGRKNLSQRKISVKRTKRMNWRTTMLEFWIEWSHHWAEHIVWKVQPCL